MVYNSLLKMEWPCSRALCVSIVILLLELAIVTSLAVQWLRLRASTAVGVGLIPGQGTKIPHAMQRGQK